MSVLDLVRIVVYRCHEKGLEVFLMDYDLQSNPEIWKTSQKQLDEVKQNKPSLNIIELEPSINSDGDSVRTYAIEGDWHDIPSIKGLLKHDIRLAKDTIKEMVPGIEKGAYVAMKEVTKKVMPREYECLKELKEIITDRNLLKYI